MDNGLCAPGSSPVPTGIGGCQEGFYRPGCRVKVPVNFTLAALTDIAEIGTFQAMQPYAAEFAAGSTAGLVVNDITISGVTLFPRGPAGGAVGVAIPIALFSIASMEGSNGIAGSNPFPAGKPGAVFSNLNPLAVTVTGMIGDVLVGVIFCIAQ